MSKYGCLSSSSLGNRFFTVRTMQSRTAGYQNTKGNAKVGHWFVYPQNVKSDGARLDPFVVEHSCPRHESSKIWEGRHNLCPKDTKEGGNVSLGVIGRGKRPTPTRLVEQVAQGVKSIGDIGVANVQNAEYTTVGIEVHFEISLSEVADIAKLTNKVRIGVGLTKTALHPTTCLVKNEVEPN